MIHLLYMSRPLIILFQLPRKNLIQRRDFSYLAKFYIKEELACYNVYSYFTQNFVFPELKSTCTITAIIFVWKIDSSVWYGQMCTIYLIVQLVFVFCLLDTSQHVNCIFVLTKCKSVIRVWYYTHLC